MRTVFALLASGWLGCGTDVPPEPPIFPADYASTYMEVRNCRPSLEHGSVNIRVLASPDALTPYTGRMVPFPTGSILLKEEYAESDLACAGPIKFWTVMQKLADDSSPATIDWQWQKLDASRHVTMSNDETCIMCHAMCLPPPDGTGGYLHTCTEP
jgi:hypothetical protein